MNLDLITPHLRPQRATQLVNTVAALDAHIAAQAVPNVVITGAKFIFNAVVAESTEAFLATGPRTADHKQSIWWRGAYDADALVSGLINVPAAIKRLEKKGALREYTAFLSALLPLSELLTEAKPLIKKRGELPKVKTAKQIEDEAKRMTCQCCNRPILANTGSIAHHGYERPGLGWQTSSCYGAKELPWEVSRDAVGRLIEMLKRVRENATETLRKLRAEEIEVTHTYTVNNATTGYRTIENTLTFTRATFAAVKASNVDRQFPSWKTMTFDDYKAVDIDQRVARITKLDTDIREFQARYDGWKQTHKLEGGQWVAL